MKESKKIANYLMHNIDNVLGPGSSTIPKINDIYYMQNGVFSIPMQDLPSGVYMIQTRAADQIFWNKVIHLKK